jgi:LuxR family maltose regulon positive regulatory protein
MQTDTLLATKLYAPPPPPGVVRRPRLLRRVHEGAQGRLTLLSASAGFGKTTLVAAWAAESELPVAWLSLDEADADAAGFLRYLIAALREVADDVGSEALTALASPQPPEPATLLPGLVNELAALDHDVAVVLDDYHAVDAREVDDAVAFLLDRAPPRLHLVLTTREDPDLPLARLRARGQMTELRAADLRFTDAEAAAFLRDATGLALSVEEVAALEARTEGWIAGLQLAALSMRGRDDVAAFVRTFAGDHRFVVDYLVDEVLRRQPEEVRDFLLETSVLARLSAPLCEAVTGRPRCDRLLDALERGNLFLVPLDDRRRWFRYHHLFAEMLRAHLEGDRPERADELRGRASAWFEAEGDPDEAVRYAREAGDLPRVADLAEAFGAALRADFRPRQLVAWLSDLPEALLRDRPFACVELARASTEIGSFDEAERRLQDAEQHLPGRDAGDAADVPTGPRRIPLDAAIATARAYLAQARADLEATARHARHALELLPEDEDFERGVVLAVQGLANWSRGEIDAGFDAFADGLAAMARAGGIRGLSPTYLLADMRIAQGRFREAERILRDALAGAGADGGDEGGVAPMGAANLELGLAEVACERGDLEGCTRHLAACEAMGEGAVQFDTEYRWHLLRARRARSDGDFDAALHELEEAERRFYPTPAPERRPIAALRAYVNLAAGRVAEAEAWAATRGLTPDDTPSYLREFELMVLARILLARFRGAGDAAALEAAFALLDRLERHAAEQGRSASVAEILVLRSLAHDVQGDASAAGAALARALDLAEPEGWLRVFTREGEAMRTLLRSAGPRTAFARAVAAAMPSRDAEAGPAPGTVPGQLAPAPLLEPLTERELEVLALIAEGLSNRQIATRLFRALPTVKGYNREIFAKLQVTRRTEAIARARELGLV